MATLLSDNSFGTLGAGLAAGDTALTFTAGHGARFPAVTGSDVLYCCILNASNVLEEVIITAHAANADTATITRAAGATVAKVWNAGDRIEARISKTALFSLNVASASTATSAITLNPSLGQVAANSTHGLYIKSRSGASINDFAIFDATGAVVKVANPAGSSNFVFSGTVISSGGFSGHLTGTADVSSAATNANFASVATVAATATYALTAGTAVNAQNLVFNGTSAGSMAANSVTWSAGGYTLGTSDFSIRVTGGNGILSLPDPGAVAPFRLVVISNICGSPVFGKLNGTGAALVTIANNNGALIQSNSANWVTLLTGTTA